MAGRRIAGGCRTADGRCRPAVLAGGMFDAGLLGGRSGKGFYDYSQ